MRLWSSVVTFKNKLWRTEMTYSITKSICINHEDGWFYKFSDDGDGCIEVSYHEVVGYSDIKQKSSFHIPKDCIQHFIDALEQLK